MRAQPGAFGETTASPLFARAAGRAQRSGDRLERMDTDQTDDAARFLDERHLAILSTFGAHGGIHSVPVGFTLADGLVRIITSDSTQKVRNVERGGEASVAQVDGRRWISFAGAARINRDPEAVARAVELYAGRYRQPRVNPRRVVVEITVAKMMGSSGMVPDPTIERPNP